MYLSTWSNEYGLFNMIREHDTNAGLYIVSGTLQYASPTVIRVCIDDFTGGPNTQRSIFRLKLNAMLAIRSWAHLFASVCRRYPPGPLLADRGGVDHPHRIRTPG